MCITKVYDFYIHWCIISIANGVAHYTVEFTVRCSTVNAFTEYFGV